MIVKPLFFHYILYSSPQLNYLLLVLFQFVVRMAVNLPTMYTLIQARDSLTVNISLDKCAARARSTSLRQLSNLDK